MLPSKLVSMISKNLQWDYSIHTFFVNIEKDLMILPNQLSNLTAHSYFLRAQIPVFEPLVFLEQKQV